MLNIPEQKIPRVRKALTCDCYELGLYMIPSVAILTKGQHSSIVTKRQGIAFLYVSKEAANEDKIKVRVQTGESEFNQTIEITRAKITFGVRRYFKCGCGRKVNALFLKRGQFACRHCHNLVYEITRLKKGTWLYKLNRSEKIQAAAHQVRNITYGKVGLTMKARRVMALTTKYS